MPEENQKDLADIPNEIREKVRWHQVNDFNQVLELALKPLNNGNEDDPESEHNNSREANTPTTNDASIQTSDAI